jgi:cysteine-S-conjugate beta-lyase
VKRQRGKPGKSVHTVAVQAGSSGAPLVRTVGPPIQRASTILVPKAAALYDGSQPVYGRKGLATRQALCRALAELEGASETRLFPSGLAAVAYALTALVKAGDHILVAEHVYRPTRAFCERTLRRFGVEVEYFPQRSTAAQIERRLRPSTALVFLESPGSLSFEMQDVPAIAAMARRRKVLTVMDNTWAAGVLFRPLAHGVDVSVQSLSKYAAGHSDILMGAVSFGSAAACRRVDAAIDDFGNAVSPEDAYLVLRSLRTLPVRLARHGESGLTVARWLARQPEVLQVLHPALPSFPGHRLWKRDYSGCSGLFGFVLRPRPPAAERALLDALELFGLGFSWGGHESLALNVDPQRRWGTVIGRYPGPLLRVHIGLEDPADLMADLRHGLDVYAKHRR